MKQSTSSKLNYTQARDHFISVYGERGLGRINSFFANNEWYVKRAILDVVNEGTAIDDAIKNLSWDWYSQEFNDHLATSKTSANERGLSVEGLKPVGYRKPWRRQGWDVYLVADMKPLQPKRTVYVPPPMEIDLLAAIWVVNRQAKRCRDRASKFYAASRHALATRNRVLKEDLYSLKDAGLQQAMSDGLISCKGTINFPDSADRLYCWVGGGYCYHSFTLTPGYDVPAVEGTLFVEAKPKKSSEPRLMDAKATLEPIRRKIVDRKERA
jgi:hypothetical protein